MISHQVFPYLLFFIINIQRIIGGNCNSHQYWGGFFCINCDSECATCSISFFCNTCNPGYYFKDYKCPQCPTGCATCTSDTVCDSCTSGYYKSDNKCIQCSSPCLTCSDASTCITCRYFVSGSTCTVCTKPCYDCSATETNCTSCIDAANQVAPTCDCTSPSKYLDPATKMCVDCVSPCKDCSSMTSCDSCVDTYLLSGNSCLACTKPCGKCSGSITNCTTCVDSTNQTLSTCQCNIGYIMNTTSYLCDQCQSPCLTCSTSITNCDSCVNGLNRHILNNSCLCDDTYYDDVVCKPCQLPCIYCSSRTNCSSCKDSIHQQLPLCKCIDTYYMDSSFICQVCSHPCKNCVTNSNNCTSCLDNYYLSSSQCYTCTLPCQNCINSSSNCTSCAHPNQTVSAGTCICDDGYFMGANLYCQQCIHPCSKCTANGNHCLDCVDTFILSATISNTCQCLDKFYEDQTNFKCQSCKNQCSKCSSFQICTQCENGYYLQNQNCDQCKTECKTCLNESNCLTCVNKYFLDAINNCLPCINNCLTCSNNLDCEQCVDGFFYQNQLCILCDSNCQQCEIQSTYCITCRPNYSLTIQNKCECLTGFYEINYECLKCQYPCQNCINDEFCLQCYQISNLFLDNSNKCQCEIGYFWLEYKCSRCKQTCLTCSQSENNCLSCDQSKFRVLLQQTCQCQSGYFQNNFYECESCNTDAGKIIESCQFKDCTDQIWTYGEQCDDGNDVVRDGCTNCLVDVNYSCLNQILQQSICYQCPSNCIKCEMIQKLLQVNCIQCQEGYFINNLSCSKCSEKCNGCQNSSFNCIKCRFLKNDSGECQLCESQVGYYSDYSKNVCFTKCGDSVQSKTEECDDGNTVDGDGCNSICQLEQKYICKDGNCITPSYPQPNLNIVGDTSQYILLRQYELTYDQELRFDQTFQLQNYLNIYILFKSNERESTYETNYTQIIHNSSNNTGYVTLKINLNIYNNSNREQVVIRFNNLSKIQSSEGYFQQISEIQCQIMPVIIIEQITVEQVQAVATSNQYVLFTMAAMCGGAILFGGIEIFYNLLDSLQLLSYLKYINTELPFNLQEYFNLFGFVQLNLVQKYLNVNELLDNIIDLNNLKQPPQKIAQDNFTTLFIVNASTIILVYLVLVFGYYLSFLIPKLLNQIKIKYYSEFSEQSTWLTKFSLYFLSLKILINQLCYTMISELFYSGIQRIHMSTAYDFAFSAILQLSELELNSQDTFVQISSILAIFASIFYAMNIFFVIRISNSSKYAIENFQNKLKYGSIFEGLNTQKKVNRYYSAIVLIKKYLFITLLIFTYQFPIFQATSLTFLSLFMSIFMIIFKPIQNLPEYIKQTTCEVSISLTLINITLLVSDSQINYFSYNSRQNIGWCCIFFITALLLTQMIIDAIQQWIILFKKLKKIQKFVEKIKNLLFNADKRLHLQKFSSLHDQLLIFIKPITCLLNNIFQYLI